MHSAGGRVWKQLQGTHTWFLVERKVVVLLNIITPECRLGQPKTKYCMHQGPEMII